MYTWIVVCGGIFSFITAMGIGANDAANAFATSVGSGALTIRKAAGLAVIFETSGAILMGSHVTDTIRKGISDYRCFENEPELLMYGCMWAMICVSGWLFAATYYEMPISTTHSCVGAMIGMTIALAGSDCVLWYKQTDNFPYVSGVLGIIMSWFISPIFSGIFSSGLFAILRHTVLRSQNSSKRLKLAFPILVGITLIINSFFIIYKGAKGLGLDSISAPLAVMISCGIGLLGSIITYPMTNCITNKSVKIHEDISNKYIQEHVSQNSIELGINNDTELKKVIDFNISAEKFSNETEEAFKYLQIFSAICDSFSHGANDVANAIGPFVAIYLISKDTNLSKKLDMSTDSFWILSLGGIGISLGLLLYGKKITNALGHKLCKITPTRGTCIELGSALVIITGSRLKIPLSTTHCQVGATVGVGLLENKRCGSINKKLLLKTCFGWVITCVIAGVSTGIMTAQGIYSPKIM
jgi:sodium-dependent phosphate transporter